MDRDNYPFTYDEIEVTELTSESQVLTLGLFDSTAQVLNQFQDGICQKRSKALGENEHFSVILGQGV